MVTHRSASTPAHRVPGVLARPFAGLFRPLTPAERGALRESVAKDGIRSPVFTYDSPTHGPAVIDGLNRLDTAAELGIPPEAIPVTDLGRISDEAAERLARDLNVARRHLTPEEQQAARVSRVKRVAELRSEGASIRVIAARVGVTKSQAERDLAEARAATVPGGTVEPETITGANGKTYPTAVSRSPPPDRRGPRLQGDPFKYIRRVKGGKFQARPYCTIERERYNLGLFPTRGTAADAIRLFWETGAGERLKFVRRIDSQDGTVYRAVVLVKLGDHPTPGEAFAAAVRFAARAARIPGAEVNLSRREGSSKPAAG